MSKCCILYSSEHEVLFPKAAKFVKMKTMIFGHMWRHRQEGTK